MSTTGGGVIKEVSGKPGESLSQLLARILDQLSVSSWLPSIALVATVLLYGNLAVNGANLEEALASIAGLKAAQIFLLLLAVVVATVLAQAFEFEAIRLLEGYWTSARLLVRLRSLLTRFQSWRVERLVTRRRTLRTRASAELESRVDLDPALREALQRLLRGRSLKDLDQRISTEAQTLGWRDFARPATVRELEMVDLALERYPTSPHKLMPTRLGNVLRGFEERAERRGTGGLEGMIQREFHRLPPTLQAEHDQFRSRLDLYCSMTLLSFISGAVGALTLLTTDVRTVLLILVLSLAFGWLFYRGAVASALAYGQTLLSVRSVLDEQLLVSADEPPTTRLRAARQLVSRIATWWTSQRGARPPAGPVSVSSQSSTRHS